ncbi:hypothetical protein SAMN03159406_00750 [Rhizobium sp. NFR03]|nr:hypothetical protein SAMN03159406_00750 [Rhizobium sp. NFR03]
MTYALNVGSTALSILRQPSSVRVADIQDSPAASNLILVANGQSSSDSPPAASQAKIAKTLFSLNATDVTKMKLDLIERTGKALGVNSDYYVSNGDFVAAMREAVAKIKAQPTGETALLAIEKDLGLDKLGISITDVIDSAAGGSGEDKVTRALEKQASGHDSDKSTVDASRVLAIDVDDIGRYNMIAENKL